MPQEAKIYLAQIFQGLPATFLARVLSLYTGKVLTATDVAAITFDVYDLDADNPDAPLESGTVTVATAIHAVILDPRWGVDQVGFNFDHTIDPTLFPEGGKVYALKYSFMAVGDTVPSAVLLYHVHVLNVRGQ